MKAVISNKTAGHYLQHAQISNSGGVGVVIDHSGPISDTARGDILKTEQQHLAVLDAWPAKSRYSAYSTVWALPLDSLAVIRRAGETIAEGLQVSVIGTDYQLTRALWQAAPVTLPAGKAAEADNRLQEIIEFLDQDNDQELLEAILARKEKREGGHRVILPAGSGVAVGDELGLSAGLSVVQAIDRSTWPGLELLTCSSPQPSGLVQKIKNCIGGAA